MEIIFVVRRRFQMAIEAARTDIFLRHLAQFSHLIFEECHSELCGVFGISRNSIFFHEVNFLFRHIEKTRRDARRPFLKIVLPP